MIVVVGIPAWRSQEPAGPAGRACDVAVAAATAGASVELVGRAGDDGPGDALMIGLAAAGVGHVAVLRDPARPTPIVVPVDADEDPAGWDRRNGTDTPPGFLTPDLARTPRLEPADVALALQYLTDFAVLVVTDDVPAAVVPVAIEAAGFAGAHLILLVPEGGGGPANVPADATILGGPVDDADGAFARVVGAYAAALDAGSPPDVAFAAAVAGRWETPAP